MPSAWEPEQYDRFAEDRAKPFHDLVGLIEPAVFGRAVDLGCGTGRLTRHAVEHLRIEHAVGVDSSESMLAEAIPHAIPGRLRFELGDIRVWTSPADHDLVLANASLHWVPDHPSVLARWGAALAPGGQLAVQVPANAHHPSHTVAFDVAMTDPFRSLVGDEARTDPVAANVLKPSEYAEVLHELGFADQHVRLQVYGHLLDRTASVVEWMKGTSLTRFRALLDDDLFAMFVARYRDRLLQALGDREPYFYPFSRILMWGRIGHG